MALILLQVIRLHREHMEDISRLQPFTTTINGKHITVRYHVICSMHDGKELNTITKDILR